jgi:hypothetical protein
MSRDRDGCDPIEAEAVGYGKPPRHTRFKKGRSGNPKGRPKAKNFRTYLREELDRPITIREGGVERRVTKQHALVIRALNDAVGGRPGASQLVSGWISRFLDQLEVEGVTITSEEREVLDALEARLAQRTTKKTPEDRR